MRNHCLAAIIVVLSMSLLGGCATNPVTGKSQLMLVSEDQEVRMGKEFYPSALFGDMGGGGEYRDEQLKAYLKDIVLRIHGVSHRANLPVDFAIQNSSVPNAWAIPGHVVITRGLLAGLDNEAEFVFVLGHEMGHVSARHSASQMSWGMVQQAGLGAAGLALSGSSYAEPAVALGSVGSSLLMLKYSRSDELEADRLGVLYMSKLGYDPRHAVSAHRNLEKVAQEYSGSVGKGTQEDSFFTNLLSTHPRTSVRIEEINGIIAANPVYARIGDGTNRQKFQQMTASLRKTNQVYRTYYDKAIKAYGENDLAGADSLMTQAISADRTEASFHTLKGFIALKKKEYGTAEQNLKNALVQDQNYEPAYRGLGGVFYFRQNYAAGADYLKRALELFPQDVGAHYLLGMGQFKTGDYRNAITHLKPVSEAQPKHPEVHGVLGICYEQVGDKQSAANEYALQVKVEPNSEIGRQASSRLGVLQPARIR
jgi:predicted Zn-dependent protease